MAKKPGIPNEAIGITFELDKSFAEDIRKPKQV